MPKNRSEIPDEDKWNVEALYPSSDLWKADLRQVQGKEGGSPRWPDLSVYKGLLADPKNLSQLFDCYFSLDRRLAKVYTYAHLRMDEDLGHDGNKSDYGRILNLLHDFQLESSWIEPELLALSDADFHRLASHPSLKPFQFYLEKVSRRKAHTLSLAEEELLALSGKSLETARKAFGALNNADLTFKPAIDSDGKEHPLSNATYLLYLRSEDRELRKTAYVHLHESYEAHANTFCELIQGLVAGHHFVAKARKFPTCLEAALFSHRVDPAVYSRLIEAVKKGLPALHEYIQLRKSILNLSEVHAYDLQVPLVKEVETSMSYKEACSTVVESVAPLGKEYQDILRKGLMTDRWVDPYENARKRSGAYSSGCYDSMPYILMSFHGTLRDVLTLAHEAGHSMHSYFSRTHQPYVYADYPIFVAEVASTFNEQLLMRHLLSKAKTKEEKAALINHEIEAIRGTVFRQTQFAEFELQLHRWAEEGVPLTPTLLKEFFVKLNREYYGPDFALDPGIAIEWARIPHFYYDFYVYQYATGLSASMALFQKVLQSKEAKDKYLQFLSSGGSKFPLDLLKIAGVDMLSPKPVEAAIQRFQELVAELKECL